MPRASRRSVLTVEADKRLFDVPRLQENRLKPRLDEAGMQPLREWPRLEADYSQGKARGFEELQECVGVAFHPRFLHNLFGCVDNAHA